MTTLQFTPSIEKPLHSYEVSLIDLSDFAPSKATSTKKKPVRNARRSAPPKTKARPPEPKANPLPPLPTQASSEQLSESFAGAVQSVVIPNELTAPSRQPAVEPIETATVPTETQDVREAIKLPKSAPKLARANRLPAQPRVSIPEPPPVPQSVPQKDISPTTLPKISAEPNVREETQKALQAIKAPPEAPTLTPIQPFRRSNRKDSPTPKTEKLSKTLRQTIQSVKVPPLRTPSTKSKKPSRVTPTEPKNSPTPPTSTPEAPQLAQVQPPQNSVSPPPAVKQKRLADSLKQVLDAVKIPKLRRSTPTEVTRPKKVTPARQDSPISRPSPESKPSKLQAKIDQQLAKLKVPDVTPIESIKKRLQVQVVTATQAGEGSSASSTSNTTQSSSAQNRYFALITELIKAKWVAPQVSMAQNHPQVILKFRILRSGEVTNLGIKRGSGNSYYDAAAQRAVRAANPLPPFPKDLKSSSLDIDYKFRIGESSS
ncbi:MAG: TonB family protein [Nitrospirales bacterium]